MAHTRGVHHVGLTVRSVEEARDFFVDVLGFDVVGGRPSYPAIFVSDGDVVVTLWQADPDCVDFDRRLCVGLHHLALRVPSSEALDGLHTTLAARTDVAIEFPPAPLGAASRHMMFTGPSGVRLELTWTPA